MKDPGIWIVEDTVKEAPSVSTPSGGTATSPTAIPMRTAAGAVVFSGRLRLSQFGLHRSRLVASGALSGIVTDEATGRTSNVIKAVWSLPATVSGNPESVFVRLGPMTVDFVGSVLTLLPSVLEVRADAAPGNTLPPLVRSVVGVRDDPHALAAVLNQMLDILWAPV